MDTIGCTTPYGNNLDNICSDPNRAKLAMELYKDKHINPPCLYPCKFLNRFAKFTNILNQRVKGRRLLMVSFKKYVSKSEAFYAYSGLDFFAAVGGYVGLCLGLSIFDIRNGFFYLIKKFNNKAT